MNPKQEYFTIIANAITRPYIPNVYHIHHIIPFSVGGPDHILNIVPLLPEEHAYVHQLLSKISSLTTHKPIIMKENQTRAHTLSILRWQMMKENKELKLQKLQLKLAKKTVLLEELVQRYKCTNYPMTTNDRQIKCRLRKSINKLQEKIEKILLEIETDK